MQTENQNPAAEGPLKIDMRIVEELTQKITLRKITRVRFRFNMDTRRAFYVLAAHYSVTVKERHGNPVFDANTQANLLALARYITQEDPKFGVMMSGTCGNGKTTLLYTLQSAINDLKNRGHFEFLGRDFRVGMMIVDAKDIVEIAKDLESLKQYRNYQMLAIDDLGKEPTEVLDYGNVLSPVVDLLEHRYNHQLFTAVTTNLTPKEIREKYGARIADRFNEMLEVIRFQDISYRTINRNGG